MGCGSTPGIPVHALIQPPAELRTVLSLAEDVKVCAAAVCSMQAWQGQAVCLSACKKGGEPMASLAKPLQSLSWAHDKGSLEASGCYQCVMENTN